MLCILILFSFVKKHIEAKVNMNKETSLKKNKRLFLNIRMNALGRLHQIIKGGENMN